MRSNSSLCAPFYCCALTESRFLGCWITGHTVACVLAIIASLVVLSRFKQNILEMRVGKSPFARMLKTTPQSAFSCASTPAVGGMVRTPNLRSPLSTLLHTRTPTYTHTHTHTHSHMHACTHIHTQACTQPRTHTHTHTLARMHAHAHTYTRARAHTHATPSHTHARTHTHTRTHNRFVDSVPNA